MSKSATKTATAIAVALSISALCLLALHRMGSLELGELSRTLARRWVLVLGSGACQAAISFITLLRYQLLLQSLGVKLPFRRLIGPALVAQAVGSWLPASMAVTEALRLGLMLGLTPPESSTGVTSTRVRVAVASVVDRVVGQAAMLFVGGCLGLGLVVTDAAIVKHSHAVLILSVLSVLGAVTLLLLPSLSGGAWLRRSAQSAVRFSPARFEGMRLRLTALIQKLAQGVAQLGTDRTWFALPSLLSASVLVLSGLATYLPGLATPHPPPYLALLVGIPLLSMSLVFPLGFAGLGSQQILAVGTLSIFDVDDSSVAAASLVQTAMGLVTATLLGMVAALFLYKDLAALRGTRGA